MSAHGGHCKHPVSGVLLRLAWLLSMLAGLARANCECGFSVTDRGNETDSWVFAEMLEVDFSTVQNMTNATGWIRQEYNVSAEDGRGEYGKAFMANNAEPMVNAGASGDKTSDGLDRVVLGLRVNGSLNNDAVPAAEIDSARLDLHWGSYRTGMKVAGNNGTCSAFFWVSGTSHADSPFVFASSPLPPRSQGWET